MKTAALARAMQARIQARFFHLLTTGFWFCLSCEGVCERKEGEQGQPAHCATCKSHRILWNPPLP
jgi:hypothetical protein